MNEFIEQFLIEARELVEQATGDLLALEEQPGDRERLDSAFRAFHTLKGAAGIIEFPAMARALHAAEDVLSEVRGDARPMTPALVGDCLALLDQVEQWLEAIQATGEPPTGADAEADAVAARFAPATAVPEASVVERPATDWLDALLAAYPDERSKARTALLYRPAPDCFFRDEDPLAVVERLPGLLAIQLIPQDEWPAADVFDPFACQLAFAVLSTATVDELRGAAPAGVELIELGATPAPARDPQPAHRAVIEAQILLLGVSDADGLAGRTASAARVGANVLRHAGREAQALAVEAALPASEAGDVAHLIAALEAALSTPPPQAGPVAPTAPQEVAARSLRVDVERVDALVRLTGELTVIKNAIGHISGLAEQGVDAQTLAARLKEQHALLDRLVGQLQHSVLGIRVLPLRHVFQRFPRLVRELGADLGKPVQLSTEGDETEADKAVVEALFEPLLHVVRNALDHGIETGVVRAAAGKSPTGSIRLRAERRGEHVVVEVEDDGGGVDIARVREVAGRRGLLTPDALGALDEAGALDLIFAPGFSTATTVTGVSGRGVGMDAVRAAVERMGGRVAIASTAGQGSLVRFILPFTVMISRVMTVEAGGQVFGVPLEAVRETVRIVRNRIFPVGAARAFVLRDRTVPLIDLAETLGTGAGSERAGEATVVVTEVAGQPLGLEVDRLGGRLDVMLKPMDGLLAGMKGIAGTTLLGDGRVLIVLDLQELFE